MLGGLVPSARLSQEKLTSLRANPAPALRWQPRNAYTAGSLQFETCVLGAELTICFCRF
jgi:hypothetical protein